MSRQDPSPSPRRRRWAFSLRSAMALVLVVGGPLGWQARRASIQRRAVAQIQAAGGTVEYDYQGPLGGPISTGAAPPAPEWLRRWTGDELFQDVRSVTLRRVTSELSDATVEAIAALDRLELLNVVGVPLTDAQAARLGPMPTLKVALLQNTRLTEVGMASIAAWSRLERLVVIFEPPAAAAPVLARAGGLHQVRRLELWPLREAASPSDFAPLAALRSLTELHLPGTKVTDEGMRRLAPLDHLQRFTADGSAVTDEGLAVVSRWADLRLLSLAGRKSDGSPASAGSLTDHGLNHLIGLQRLDDLIVAGRFTDAGLATLARSSVRRRVYLRGIQEAGTVDGLKGLLVDRPVPTLGLEGPGVRDDWMPILAAQPQLLHLSLSGPHLTDAALMPLVASGSLQHLGLTGTRVTDAGLMALARGGSKLRRLYLEGETAVTPGGVAAFRAACPACRVDYRPGPGRP